MKAQNNPLRQLVSVEADGMQLVDVLYQLIDESDVKLVFNNAIIPEKSINATISKKPLSAVLPFLFDGTDLIWSTSGQLIIIKKDPLAGTLKSYTVSGFVLDGASGEPLVGASVFCRFLGMGTITNSYGFFSLKLPEGVRRIDVSYLGFSPKESSITIDRNLRFDWKLRSSLTLREVIVVANDSTNFSTERISSHRMSLTEMDLGSTIIGEKDILRNIQLLPGVQTGADGVGGLFVRGGNASQNLVMLDGVPVYSTAHGVGLLSIFNPEILRSAKIIKGGFPARYGGRLSSVIELRTKEGNAERWSGWLNSSLATANFGVEGPIVKGKSAILLTGRASFLNAYFEPYTVRLKREKGDTGYSKYQFSDWNAKVNYFFSNKDKIYFNFYYGNDEFEDKSRVEYEFSAELEHGGTRDFLGYQSLNRLIDWKNRVAGFRWNHLFSNRLFGNTALSYSQLGAGIGFDFSDSLLLKSNLQTVDHLLSGGQFRSGISEFSAKQDFDFVPRPNEYVRFGAVYKRRVFSSNLFGFDHTNPDSIDNTESQAEKIRATSFSFYWEKDIERKKWLLNFGLRGASHSVFKKLYFSVEPRLSAQYTLGKNSHLTVAYSRMTQFVHLLSPTSIGLATDLWVPSTDLNRPQVANQWVLGFNHNFKGVIFFSVEGYYKTLDHLISFSEGSILFNDWKKNVTSGAGRSKGLDFLVERSGNRFDFRLAYTYSFTDRVFEKINLGRRYPFKYDRRHDFKASFFYDLSSRLHLSANWVYGTGIATTLPKATYTIKLLEYLPVEEIDVLYYGTRNSFRLPAYHRLDLSLNYKFKTGCLHHQVGVGVYNLYNNQNPLYYEVRSRFVEKGEKLVQEFYFVQVTLASVLPSLNYSVKF